MKRKRVLIVEDSPVVGEHLRRIIAADPSASLLAPVLITLALATVVTARGCRPKWSASAGGGPC